MKDEMQATTQLKGDGSGSDQQIWRGGLCFFGKIFLSPSELMTSPFEHPTQHRI